MCGITPKKRTSITCVYVDMEILEKRWKANDTRGDGGIEAIGEGAQRDEQCN